MTKELALISPVSAAIVLSACGSRSASSSPAHGSLLAMEACHISQNASDGDRAPVLTREPLSGGKGTWDYWTHLDELRAIADYWKIGATAAEAASQIDAKWKSLSSALSFNFLVVTRIVSLREQLDPKDPALTDRDTLLADYLDFNEQAREYNANLPKIDLMCDAIIEVASG